MQLPLHISFKNLAPSEVIEANIRKHAARLDHFFNRIVRCHVVVTAPQRHQRKGRLYNVRIDLTVPQHEIVVNQAPRADHAYEDIQVAIREAFNSAARQLEDYARRMRGDVKRHSPVRNDGMTAPLPQRASTLSRHRSGSKPTSTKMPSRTERSRSRKIGGRD